MKRLFTLAFVAMIASLTFAQAPVQKKAATKSQVEKVVTTAQMQKAMAVKAALSAKAQAAQVTSGSVLRHAAKPSVAAANQLTGFGFVSNQAFRTVDFAQQHVAPAKSVKAEFTNNVTVTKDVNGIITSVEGGEARVYTRSNDGLYYSEGISYQSGSVNVVVDGNDFYIKNPVCGVNFGAWVKGTLSADGKVLTVPTGQPLYYSSNYDACLLLTYGNFTGSTFVANTGDDITYAVEGDVLSLNGADASIVGENVNFETTLGVFWSDDSTWQQYAEWNTVLTYDPDYVAPSTDLVVLPNGADILNWYMSGSAVSSSSATPFRNQAVNVAFVDNDVYLQGVFTELPTAWIKGTKEGNTVTFNKFQYIGNYSGAYDMYFIGTDGQSIMNATATLSADSKTLTFNESLLANAATDRIYYLQWIEDAVVSAEQAEEPAITNLTATLPYTNTFDTAEEQAQAAIYDANGDGKTFTFAAPSGGDNTTPSARYAYSSSNEGDDYVVFPGLTLVAGTSYKVSVDARGYSANFPEKFEVVCGTVAKASGLSTVVIAPTEVKSGVYETHTAEFVPEADGVYYFAIHAISDADQFYLYTDNFSVQENNPNSPQAPANLVVTPDAEAGLSAAIVFNAPSKNVGGADLVGNVTCVVMRNGEVIFGDVVVAPGATVELTDDNVPASGTYVYSVFAITKEELASDVVTASVYVGEDTPDDVENLEAIDQNGKVALSWDAPTDGVLGGIIIAENLKYNVYPAEMVEFWGMQFPSIDFENPYFTGLTETEAEVEFDTNSGEQGYSYFGVTAENTAGESNGAMASVLTGAPYELPFVEEFNDGISYWWGVDYDDDNYEADGGAGLTGEELVLDAQTAGWIELYSGKIALNGANKAQLTFDYYGDGALSVLVYGPNKELAPVSLTPGAESKKAAIDLAELANEPWIRFTLHGEYEAAGQTFIDNVIVMDMLENDLEVSVSAPKTVVAGATASVVATVKNVGTVAASDYVVKFYVNEEEVETVSEVETLAFLASAQYTYSLETTIFDEAGDVTVKAEVVLAADQKPETNSDEVVVTVAAPSATPVATVSAEETEQGVVISWTVAENIASEVTEDFESYEGNTVYADGESCGPWAAVDAAPGDSYFWNSEAILWPHWENPYAFGIMNFEMSALSLEAVSGDQCVLFMSNTTAASKYMISSELPGVAQTVSFQAMVITDQYGAETFEVLASSTDANVASFTKVADFSTEDVEWTEFSANLPEGTKYFAIHYTSNDIFGLFIDDLKYTTGGGAPTGFNVYVDKALVATVAAENGSYTYTTALVPGSHDFAVSAVYGKSESAAVSCTITGIENISVANSVEIFTVDGVRVNDVKNLKSGVYVVNGKKVVK